MGFTASTGGAMTNIRLKMLPYIQIKLRLMPAPMSFCPSESAQIGVPSNPNYVYSWSPPIGLSSVNSSSPAVTSSMQELQVLRRCL